MEYFHTFSSRAHCAWACGISKACGIVQVLNFGEGLPPLPIERALNASGTTLSRLSSHDQQLADEQESEEQQREKVRGPQ